ncbi:hypothetical protein E2562_011591 [Oryza meyeriana var. granulata]|uniref:Uncharacterized protein n=1 Tax=Oryza meyeriana var. granulata TaxID=110450 RepID=A0A6G1DWI1_9ORYZ|nr:hypothetical protein E2562_011591 [Oryza meyeriana var. granulata]
MARERDLTSVRLKGSREMKTKPSAVLPVARGVRPQQPRVVLLFAATAESKRDAYGWASQRREHECTGGPGRGMISAAVPGMRIQRRTEQSGGFCPFKDANDPTHVCV